MEYPLLPCYVVVAVLCCLFLHRGLTFNKGVTINNKINNKGNTIITQEPHDRQKKCGTVMIVENGEEDQWGWFVDIV